MYTGFIHCHAPTGARHEDHEGHDDHEDFLVEFFVLIMGFVSFVKEPAARLSETRES